MLFSCSASGYTFGEETHLHKYLTTGLTSSKPSLLQARHGPLPLLFLTDPDSAFSAHSDFLLCTNPWLILLPVAGIQSPGT